MDRPNIKDYFPDDMTPQMLNNTFLENIELYNYIQALDNYINELSNRLDAEVKSAYTNIEKQESIVEILYSFNEELVNEIGKLEYRKVTKEDRLENTILMRAVGNALFKILKLDNLKVTPIE